MGLLSREGMRDGDIGICWDAGHIGICGDMWDMWRYVGYVGRTTSPKSARPGCRFLDHPPQSTKDGKQERQTINEPKKECLFYV